MSALFLSGCFVMPINPNSSEDSSNSSSETISESQSSSEESSISSESSEESSTSSESSQSSSSSESTSSESSSTSSESSESQESSVSSSESSESQESSESSESSESIEPDDGYYHLRFDDVNNKNFSTSGYNNFEKFNATNSKSESLLLLERYLTSDSSDQWRLASNRAEMVCMDKTAGLTDIVVNYSTYDTERSDGYVSIKYGWETGYSLYGYDSSPLNKYEHSLDNGDLFDFEGLKPSYFYLYFENVHIESIDIRYTNIETLPDISGSERYELVTSLSEINSSDIYTISSAKTESGYVRLKSRIALSCRAIDNAILYNEEILQLKFIQSGDYYHIQTLNYTDDNGYLYGSKTTKDNEMYIDPDNASDISLSFNASGAAEMFCDASGITKKMCFYSDASSSAFNFYIKYNNADKLPVYIYKYVPSSIETKIIDSSTVASMSNKYSNGNYGKFANGGTTYEYYRGVKSTSSEYAFKLVSVNYYYNDHGFSGCFYNTYASPIFGIKKIEVTYKAASGIKVGYSKNAGELTTSTLDPSSSYVTSSVDVDKMNFFKVMTNGSDAFIKEITLTYTNNTVSYSSTAEYTGSRKSVSAYSGTLIDGVSTATMYISSTETKTYTYYSKQYCYENYASINKDEAFMIDPVDVCNYYIAFHIFPANYVTSGEKSTYGSKFGSYARQVSTYTRTDGYATAVPYNKQPGKSTPIYYELDINLDGTYSLSSRQTGRVVVWEYGFSCYSDGNTIDPVCVYTDDHYATFQEYNCMGGFAERFNSERTLLGYVYTPLAIV